VANNLTTNPIQLTTAGATSAITTALKITGFIVIASADTWSCVIHDAASGSVIFRADSDIANHRSVYIPITPYFPARGLYYTTGTDIALVLVYTKPIYD